MIEIKPTGCVGCVKLRSRLEGDVKIFDYCSLFTCTITDEMNGACGWCQRVDA